MQSERCDLDLDSVDDFDNHNSNENRQCVDVIGRESSMKNPSSVNSVILSNDASISMNLPNETSSSMMLPNEASIRMSDENFSKEYLMKTEREVEKPSFSDDFNVWYHDFNISRDGGSKILKNFKEHLELQIPSDTLTVLQTPLVTIKLQKTRNGSYYHFGIEKMLQKYNMEFLFGDTDVEIDIRIDGTPLYKSSITELWPIVGRFVDKKSATIFDWGLVCGQVSLRTQMNF
jgi:hypothetical protein